MSRVHKFFTSQETHYVSATKPNWLMLFRETVAVYCENHTEHRDIQIYKHSVRTSQETYHVSATEPNRLMLFRETVAVYCENHTEHTNTLCGQLEQFPTVTTEL
jgi:predicted Zn-dependent protease with MMP-like domain